MRPGRPPVDLAAVAAGAAPLLLGAPRGGVPPEALEPLPVTGVRHERFERLERFGAPRALRLDVLAGEIGEVLARVAIHRQFGRHAERLAPPRLARARQRLELGARAVADVLGGDLPPLAAPRTRDQHARCGAR